MLIVANAFLAVLLAGVALAGLVRIHNELYPFVPLRLAETRKLDDVSGQWGVGIQEVTPSGAAALQPRAGFLQSPEPARQPDPPGLYAGPSGDRSLELYCSIPGRAEGCTGGHEPAVLHSVSVTDDTPPTHTYTRTHTRTHTVAWIVKHRAQ